MKLIEESDASNRIIASLSDNKQISDETIENLPVLVRNQLELKDFVKTKQLIVYLEELKESIEEITLI